VGQEGDREGRIWFGDKIHSVLKGYNVLFKLETI